MTVTYTAHGKLMITGEYLALLGARCLAWPTKATQTMDVTTMASAPGTLIWNAIDHEGNPWFDALIATDGPYEVISASDPIVADKLIHMLKQERKMGGRELGNQAYSVETNTHWPMEWGLGSSSSLIVNLAAWLEVNPFELQKNTIGGSGYDIACGMSDSPIVFQMADKLLVGKVSRPPVLLEYAGFAYLGQKASTSDAIKNFHDKVANVDVSKKIDLVNRLAYHILDGEKVGNIIKAIEIHEETIGYLLDIEPIKRRMFPDFNGMVKSLGAWGGDFVMFVGREPLKDYKEATEKEYGLKLYSAEELLV